MLLIKFTPLKITVVKLHTRKKHFEDILLPSLLKSAMILSRQPKSKQTCIRGMNFYRVSGHFRLRLNRPRIGIARNLGVEVRAQSRVKVEAKSFLFHSLKIWVGPLWPLG